MPRRSLVETLDLFLRHGSGIAYVHRRGYRTVRWSYRGIVEAACQFARTLEARQIGKGDRVLLWGENCAEWVVAFLGCVLRGAVVVPMDRVASADFVLRVARQVDAKWLVCSREQARLAPGWPSVPFEDLVATLAPHSRARYPSPELKREDTVEIVFTSGTTADPKGVVISHGNILANLEPLETQIAEYIKYERIFHPIRFLNLLPLSHVFGQFLGIFVPPLLGGTLIFQDTLNPSEVIRTIRRERVSVLVGVPRLLESLRQKIERDFETEGRTAWFQDQFRAAEGEHFVRRWWRFRRVHNRFGWKFWAFISGGAALGRDTEEFWRRLSFVVIQGYGLTETTSLVSVNHPFRTGRGSIGKVLPGREIKLAENGEILVRGESIAAGYWQGQQLKLVLGQEGWFHTGDVGELDAEGNLYFKGRRKNVIVTPEGMNVYPEDLEAVLRRQPEVRDCVVIGFERDANAEPCAVLILRDATADPAPIVHRANRSLAEFQQMRRWFVWPEEDFPRSSTQKPRINVIQQAAQEQLAAPGVSHAPPGTLAELIASVTGRPPAGLSPGASLAADLDLNSLDRIELLSALEDRYQIDLDETTFTAATTVGELERMLREPRPAPVGYVYPRWAQREPMRWLRLVFYYVFVWPATMLLAAPRVRGCEHLRGIAGPLLIISNHVTFLDIGFVLAALPARLRHRLAVAMEGERVQAMRHPPASLPLWERWLDRMDYLLITALFNVFPLPQKTGFRESFQFAGESADRGYSVLVFPEGRRTPDGKLSPFRAGTGLLANNLSLPIVPLRIDGLYELKKSGKRMARPGVVEVSIGPVVRFEPGTDPAEITRELEMGVTSLGRGGVWV